MICNKEKERILLREKKEDGEKAIKQVQELTKKSTEEQLILPWVVDQFKLTNEYKSKFVYKKKLDLSGYDDRINKEEVDQILEKTNQTASKFPNPPKIDYSTRAQIIGIVSFVLGIPSLMYPPLGLFLLGLGVVLFFGAIVITYRVNDKEKLADVKKKRGAAVMETIRELNKGPFYNSDFSITLQPEALFMKIDINFAMGVKLNHVRYPKTQASTPQPQARGNYYPGGQGGQRMPPNAGMNPHGSGVQMNGRMQPNAGMYPPGVGMNGRMPPNAGMNPHGSGVQMNGRMHPNAGMYPPGVGMNGRMPLNHQRPMNQVSPNA